LRWRSVPRAALAWREWDGDFVVRNDRSGSTHLLGPLAGSILLALTAMDGAGSVDDLAIALEAPVPIEPNWRDSIEGALSEFERLELARPDAR